MRLPSGALSDKLRHVRDYQSGGLNTDPLAVNPKTAKGSAISNHSDSGQYRKPTETAVRIASTHLFDAGGRTHRIHGAVVSPQDGSDATGGSNR